jgi:hypothetical protein
MGRYLPESSRFFPWNIARKWIGKDFTGIKHPVLLLTSSSKREERGMWMSDANQGDLSYGHYENFSI